MATTLAHLRNAIPQCIRWNRPTKLRSLCAVTISVHYTEELEHALPNRNHFDRWIIVTAPDDLRTQNFCKKHGLECIISMRLKEGGTFNKGKAINDGIAELRNADWILLIDSDIILPEDFRDVLHAQLLDRKALYSLQRVLCSNAAALQKYRTNPSIAIREVSLLALWSTHAAYDPSICDDLLRASVPFIGYFQLFHASTGLRYPEQYPTAGDSDLEFMEYFPSTRRRLLPLECAHLGMPFKYHEGRKEESPVRFLAIGACNGLIEWRGIGCPNTTDGDTIYRRVRDDGWQGVLVEPNPVMFQELRRTYDGIEGIMLEHTAVAEKSGTRDFFVCHGNPLISSFSLDHIRKHDAWCKEHWMSTVERISVRCMTVEEILEKHHMRNIDVLHVDAEGYDGTILQSIDWGKIRPASVYYEHLHLHAEERDACTRMLSNKGYTVIDANPWNTLAQLPGCALRHC
jgi:FkbM family methyltransferase